MAVVRFYAKNDAAPEGTLGGKPYFRGAAGAQFNSFVEISTDFSTEFLVLQGVPHYYKNSVEKSVEKSVEISTKLLNCAPGSGSSRSRCPPPLWRTQREVPMPRL